MEVPESNGRILKKLFSVGRKEFVDEVKLHAFDNWAGMEFLLDDDATYNLQDFPDDDSTPPSDMPTTTSYEKEKTIKPVEKVPTMGSSEKETTLKLVVKRHAPPTTFVHGPPPRHAPPTTVVHGPPPRHAPPTTVEHGPPPRHAPPTTVEHGPPPWHAPPTTVEHGPPPRHALPTTVVHGPPPRHAPPTTVEHGPPPRHAPPTTVEHGPPPRHAPPTTFVHGPPPRHAPPTTVEHGPPPRHVPPTTVEHGPPPRHAPPTTVEHGPPPRHAPPITVEHGPPPRHTPPTTVEHGPPPGHVPPTTVEHGPPPRHAPPTTIEHGPPPGHAPPTTVEHGPPPRHAPPTTEKWPTMKPLEEKPTFRTTDPWGIYRPIDNKPRPYRPSWTWTPTEMSSTMRPHYLPPTKAIYEWNPRDIPVQHFDWGDSFPKYKFVFVTEPPPVYYGGGAILKIFLSVVGCLVACLIMGICARSKRTRRGRVLVPARPVIDTGAFEQHIPDDRPPEPAEPGPLNYDLPPSYNECSFYSMDKCVGDEPPPYTGPEGAQQQKDQCHTNIRFDSLNENAPEMRTELVFDNGRVVERRSLTSNDTEVASKDNVEERSVKHADKVVHVNEPGNVKVNIDK